MSLNARWDIWLKKAYIIALHKHTDLLRKIVVLTDVAVSTVSRIIKHYKDSGTTERRNGFGGSKVLSWVFWQNQKLNTLWDILIGQPKNDLKVIIKIREGFKEGKKNTKLKLMCFTVTIFFNSCFLDCAIYGENIGNKKWGILTEER